MRHHRSSDSSWQLGYRDDTRNQTKAGTTALATLSRSDNFGTTPIAQVIAGETSAGHQYDVVTDDVYVDKRP